MEETMPIRAISDKHYKGISELYRKSDGVVTGYYVTYRDLDGKPVKRRVDADTRDEALIKLKEIKQQIDLQKQGKNMGALNQKPAKQKLVKVMRAKKPAQVFSAKTLHEYQNIISDHKGVAVVSMIDIVAFDDINVIYGYEKGTLFVKEVYRMIDTLLQDMKHEDFFAAHNINGFSYELFHMYADKLCLLIKHDLNPYLLDVIIKKLLSKVSKHAFTVSEGGFIHLNLTVGATKTDSTKSLVYAEKALLEAKKLHCSYIFYDRSLLLDEERGSDSIYETLLSNITQNSVIPYFQGIFDSSKDAVPHKFETLMRLVDENGSVLSPALFMEKSKEYRVYTQLMEQMMDKVFAVLNDHDVSVTLNLSYTDINNAELCETLIRKIKESKVGERLTVEILESEQIRDIELAREFIFTLKKHDVRIAIDDFGSGFSNFDTIMHLDVDYVKLDGSLISKIHDRKYRIILENMVRICHDLGIKTIAEYISDEGIMRLAKSIGVDYLQGYHLHEPMHWENVSEVYGYKGGQDA